MSNYDPNRPTQFITALGIPKGKVIFLDENTPIGVAARDIPPGPINYDPLRNTEDVTIENFPRNKNVFNLPKGRN